MQASVTVPMAAQADEIWNIVADVRNTGKFSPEVIEAEWLDGATGPALGARFRGHVRRNEIGPVYWTTCRVTACEPGREFGFEVLVGDTPGEQLALPLHPDGRRHRRHRVVPDERQRLHQGVRGVRRPAPHAAQHPRHAQDAGADQGTSSRRLGARRFRKPIPMIGIQRPNSQMPHWWKPSSHTGFTS